MFFLGIIMFPLLFNKNILLINNSVGKVLIQAKPSMIDEENASGYTAVHLAAKSGQNEMLRWVSSNCIENSNVLPVQKKKQHVFVKMSDVITKGRYSDNSLVHLNLRICSVFAIIC